MRLPVFLLLILATAVNADELLIRNVTVIDPLQGNVGSHDVHIRNGVIENLQPPSTVSGESRATIIDGTGKFMVPGLADMHVHLEHFQDPAILQQFLDFGITFVRNMDGRPYLLEWRKKVSDGKLPGPEIYTAGPIIDGERLTDPAHVSVNDAETARAATIVQHDAGYDFIKSYHGLSEEAFAAIQSTAQNIGLKTAGHIPFRMEMPSAVSKGLGSIEHLDGYDELIESDASPFRHRWHWKKMIFAFPVDAERMHAIAKKTAGIDALNIPTMVAKDWRWLNPQINEACRQRAATLDVPAAIHETWSPANWTGQRKALAENLTNSDMQDIRQGLANMHKLVGALHGSGATLMAGTDTPNPCVIPGLSLHEELEHFVAAGLSPLEALRAATSTPARWLDREEQQGCVKTGCAADLLLLRSDPTDSVRALRQIDMIIIDGNQHENEEPALGQ
jgi:hypothetical protein